MKETRWGVQLSSNIGIRFVNENFPYGNKSSIIDPSPRLWHNLEVKKLRPNAMMETSKPSAGWQRSRGRCEPGSHECGKSFRSGKLNAHLGQ